MRKQTPLRAVLFDWDGTLLDSYQADSQAYLAMFRGLGIPWTLRELERHYSPDWHRVYRAARLARSRWEEADRLWRSAYRRQRSRLLPGARRVLRWTARRFTTGLVTSGNRARVLPQLRRFGLLRFFAVRICTEDALRRKPHPAPLQEAVRRLRLPPGQCVYVGDAPEDVEMARRSGMPVVAVLGPFPTHRRLCAARPDALLESITELPALLRAWTDPSRRRRAKARLSGEADATARQ